MTGVGRFSALQPDLLSSLFKY